MIVSLYCNITDMLITGLSIKLSPSNATRTCSSFLPLVFMSSYHRVKANKYTEHFRTLELPEDSSKGNVRRKYIELVKKFHPDTYKDNGEKFNQIDFSYRVLMKKFQEDQER